MKNAVQNNPRQSIATFRLAAPPMVWLAKAVVLWAAAFALLAAPSAFAASGNWNVTTKWSPAAVPGTAAGDVVGLTFDITAARIVTLNVAATVGTLNIGDPTTGFFAYTLSGASIL